MLAVLSQQALRLWLPSLVYKTERMDSIALLPTILTILQSFLLLKKRSENIKARRSLLTPDVDSRLTPTRHLIGQCCEVLSLWERVRKKKKKNLGAVRIGSQCGSAKLPWKRRISRVLNPGRVVHGNEGKETLVYTRGIHLDQAHQLINCGGPVQKCIHFI